MKSFNIYIYIYEFHHIGNCGKLLIQRKMMMKIQGYQQADISTKIKEKDSHQKPT
jgi:hypothetical protein